MQIEQEAIDYLIVDDDEAFRSRLVRALEERKQTAAGSADLSGALRILQDRTVRRIVLDLRLGSENGLSLLEQLPEGGAIPEVVVLTGYGSIATATKSIKLGAVNFVSKPLSVDEIIGAFEAEPAEPPEAGEIAVPSLPEVEWEHIQRVLSDCGGNISKTAKLLGLHRRSLQRKLQRSPK